MSNVAFSQESTRLMSSFPSLAMNLLTAMCTTKPASDSVGGSATDVPHTAVTESPEQVSMAIRPSKNDIGEVVSPRPKSRRRSSQSKTSYRLAHPAPSARQWQRFRIRPRTLLQLQQISNTSRPEPVIDVLPSVLFAPRLARRAPQIFQGKQGAGLDDLVVLHSQTHEPAVDAQARLSRAVGDESPNDSEIVAAICRSKPWNGDERPHTTIRFSHESAWTAVALRSGAYEFVCSEGGETPSIARWVPKREKDDGGSPTIRGSRNANTLGFKFSLIDTKSRRHPVIANMSRHSIDVYDRFSLPSTPRDTRHYTDAESLDSAVLEDNAENPVYECDGSHKTVIETDDHLRTLVIVTGIWVAFCEGWSPYFRYGTKQAIPNGISEVSNRRRSNTAEALPCTEEEPYDQQLESTKGLRYRPRMIHMASQSSVPSSPSLRSPMLTPKRTFSSSTSGVCYDYSARHPFQGTDCQRSIAIRDPANDVERVDPGTPLVAHVMLEESARVHNKVYKLPPLEPNVRKESGQDLVSQATLIDEEVKRTSRFRRMMSHLRRTRTIHR